MSGRAGLVTATVIVTGTVTGMVTGNSNSNHGCDRRRSMTPKVAVTEILTLTLILEQPLGCAGRPQFDNHGVASILVHEPKKNFYKKFLYEPFPVESSLPGAVCLSPNPNPNRVSS